jgi:hypothetical protein
MFIVTLMRMPSAKPSKKQSKHQRQSIGCARRQVGRQPTNPIQKLGTPISSCTFQYFAEVCGSVRAWAAPFRVPGMRSAVQDREAARTSTPEAGAPISRRPHAHVDQNWRSRHDFLLVCPCCVCCGRCEFRRVPPSLHEPERVQRKGAVPPRRHAEILLPQMQRV